MINNNFHTLQELPAFVRGKLCNIMPLSPFHVCKLLSIYFPSQIFFFLKKITFIDREPIKHKLGLGLLFVTYPKQASMTSPYKLAQSLIWTRVGIVKWTVFLAFKIAIYHMTHKNSYTKTLSLSRPKSV